MKSSLAIAPVQADRTAASMQEIKREIEEFIGARGATDAEVAAKRLLAPERLTWVVGGDLDVIGAEVRALQLGEIRIVDADGNPAGNP